MTRKSKREDGRGHWPAGRRRNEQPPPKGWPTVEAFLADVRDYCLANRKTRELAYHLDVHHETVRRWLSGRKWPERETMLRIARWYRSRPRTNRSESGK